MQLLNNFSSPPSISPIQSVKIVYVILLPGEDLIKNLNWLQFLHCLRGFFFIHQPYVFFASHKSAPGSLKDSVNHLISMNIL